MHQAKILVVDDSRAIRISLERTLRAAGYEVFVACDGLEAVRKALEVEPDLVILDIQMPEMDGYAACNHILQQNGSLPVIFLTNNRAAHLNALGDQLGAYLPKPADDKTLVTTVRNLLQPEPAQSC
jgi:DNA-binding response OmpR family regulator